MRLYVVRHAQAQADSPTGLDRDRPLTGLGVRQAAWLAERLAGAAVPPELVLISGAIRTRQTAEPIVAALGCPMLVCDPLWPGAVASEAMEMVAEHAGVAAIAVIGHNPQLEHLVAALVAGPTAADDRIVPGQGVELECDSPVTVGSARLLGIFGMP